MNIQLHFPEKGEPSNHQNYPGNTCWKFAERDQNFICSGTLHYGALSLRRSNGFRERWQIITIGERLFIEKDQPLVPIAQNIQEKEGKFTALIRMGRSLTTILILGRRLSRVYMPLASERHKHHCKQIYRRVIVYRTRDASGLRNQYFEGRG